MSSEFLLVRLVMLGFLEVTVAVWLYFIAIRYPNKTLCYSVI